MIAKFFSLTMSELFLRGFKFVFFIALANFFTQEIVYEYSYFTALFSILFVMSDFGSQTYITKILSSSKKTKIHFEYVNISILRVVLFVFVSLPILLFYNFSSDKLYFYVFLLFLADSFMALYFSFLRSNFDSKKEAKLKITIAFLYLFAAVSLYVVSLKFAFLFLSFGYLAFAMINANFVSKKNIYYFYRKINFKLCVQIFLKSFYIFLGSIFTIIYLRVDILMLAWLDLKSSVAFYSVASRVLELSFVVPLAISALLLPYLCKKQDDNIKKSLLIQFFIGIAVLLVFILASNLIINIIFPKYQKSIEILNILLFSIPIMLVNNYIFSYFIAKNLSKFYATIAIVIAFLNIILNYLFIPKFSYMGASFTTVFTEFLGMVLALFFMYKKGGFYENSHSS